jgi:hypothetical protein
VISRRKKPRKAGFFCDPSGLYRKKLITWEQKRQRQEPMRQLLGQRQEPMRQLLGQRQELLQVLALVLGLLFCRKRTKQQQR